MCKILKTVFHVMPFEASSVYISIKGQHLTVNLNGLFEVMP